MAPTTLTIYCFCAGCVVSAIAASTDSVGAAACESPGSACENADLEVQEERESATAWMEMLQTHKKQKHQHDAVSALELEAFVEKHLRFENQSARDAFTTKQVSTWKRYHANMSKGEEIGLLSTDRVTRRSTCPLLYANQFFKPQLNLCGNSSFTGIDNCTEPGCHTLSSSFYQHWCHPVYYSNAENNDDGYGMCGCMPKSALFISRNHSSSGNNIYSCSISAKEFEKFEKVEEKFEKVEEKVAEKEGDLKDAESEFSGVSKSRAGKACLTWNWSILVATVALLFFGPSVSMAQTRADLFE